MSDRTHHSTGEEASRWMDSSRFECLRSSENNILLMQESLAVNLKFVVFNLHQPLRLLRIQIQIIGLPLQFQTALSCR